MKSFKKFIRFLAVLIVLAACLGVQPGSDPAAASRQSNLSARLSARWKIHRVTSGNIDPTYPYISYIDQPDLNDPVSGAGYLLEVTSNWNPGGIGGVYNNHPIAVWYNHALHRWAVVNQDGAAFTPGAAFNVMWDNMGQHDFCHSTSSATVSGAYSVIDVWIVNGRSDARLIMTEILMSAAPPVTLYDHITGVLYDPGAGRWRVYNQDGTSMSDERRFCFQDVSAYANSWLHIVNTSTNVWGHYTWLDWGLATRRNVLVFATYFMGALGAEYYSDHPLGVWWDSSHNDGSWSIFNQDIAPMVDTDVYFVFAIVDQPVYLPLIVR
jgi:hypothetical protein